MLYDVTILIQSFIKRTIKNIVRINKKNLTEINLIKCLIYPW